MTVESSDNQKSVTDKIELKIYELEGEDTEEIITKAILESEINLPVISREILEELPDSNDSIVWINGKQIRIGI